MQVEAYHLCARSPFHLGLRGVGVEETAVYATADTLFSALCHTIRQLEGSATLDKWLASYGTDRPALVLSSAFPWAPLSDGKPLRLWPRPVGQPPGLQVGLKDHKEVKGIAWLSEDVWNAWTSGQAMQDQWATGSRLQSGKVWVTQAERERLAADRFWSTGDAPRVTVDRITNASEVYQAGRVQYAAGGGLWFAALWGSDDWRTIGDKALQVLGDAGLGGERSSGHGQYSVGTRETLKVRDFKPAGRCVLLSPFWPRSQVELSAVVSGQPAYQLQVRRGWMSSPDDAMLSDAKTGVSTPVSGSALRRKSVRMFAEGSVLSAASSEGYMGGLADVAPEGFTAHRVARYGVSLLAGCGAPSEEADHA